MPPIPVLEAPPPPWREIPELKDKTPEQVREHLGEPDVLLDSASGVEKLMDYQGDGCVLTIFFRLHGDAIWRTSNIWEITPGGEVENPWPCYNSILALRASSAAQ